MRKYLGQIMKYQEHKLVPLQQFFTAIILLLMKFFCQYQTAGMLRENR